MTSQFEPVLRSCIACRKKSSKDELLRTVLRDGELILDVSHTEPGRGGWVHSECVEKAIERNSFKYAFRTDQQINTDKFITNHRRNHMSAKAHTQS